VRDAAPGLRADLQRTIRLLDKDDLMARGLNEQAELKSWPELQMRIIRLAGEISPPPELRPPQAKLPRNYNQIARRRIRQFESDMPSVCARYHRARRPDGTCLSSYSAEGECVGVDTGIKNSISNVRSLIAPLCRTS
jgi:hypothetical protein